jgi:protein-S-isoprenylcysteine O-methyltransferase Ste14
VVAITVGQLGLGAAAWGGVGPFLAHPARAATMAIMLASGIAAAFSGATFDRGRREDVQNRWVVPLAIVASVVMGWQLPYLDRRDRWVLDGDVARYLGLALLVPGAVLRIWPTFVLGHRFSAYVAIQEGHTLVTTGPYRWVRHPSYAGAILGFLGWALVFRSILGLVLLAPAWLLLQERIRAEEALLASEFGEAYAAYRARTWRLIPGVY